MSFFDDDEVPSGPPPTNGQSYNRSSPTAAGSGGYDNRSSDNGNRGNGGGGGSGYSGGNGYNGGDRRGGGGGGGDGKRFERKPEDPGFVYLPYAVTGNNKPSSDVVERIGKVMRKLDSMAYVARVGGHTDLEKAVEGFADPKTVEVHLPFKGFDERQSKFSFTGTFVTDVAAMFHASWDGLSKGARVFMAKNIKLLAGKDGKSRAMFLIVWSEDGAETTDAVSNRTGNVGHIIKAAQAYRIPVFNFGNRDAEERLAQYLSKL